MLFSFIETKRIWVDTCFVYYLIWSFYFQGEKLLTPDVPKTDKVSPISLPSNILANHAGKTKLEVNSLRAGVSLDAGALAKQSMSPIHKKSYANINAEDKVTSNGIIQNGPCTLSKDGVYLSNPPSTFLNETSNGIIC